MAHIRLMTWAAAAINRTRRRKRPKRQAVVRHRLRVRRSDGKPINPNYATTRFRILVRRAGLAPVRLPDLRHGAASLAHEAGADLKTLQDLLGHSSRRHVHQRAAADPAPMRRRHCPARLERSPPHPEEDQGEGPQEPARPRPQNRHDRAGGAENRCFTPAKRKPAANAQVTNRSTPENAVSGVASASHPSSKPDR